MTSPIVITAPTLPLSPFSFPVHSIFLAGAIDMGAAVDWQAQVIDALQGIRCLLFNPRRAVPFTPDMLDEQILWELNALDSADTVLMWFPANSKAPVAMFETGLFFHSKKLVLGAEEGFYRRRNLELTAKHYGVPLHNSLEETIVAARDRVILGDRV